MCTPFSNLDVLFKECLYNNCIVLFSINHSVHWEGSNAVFSVQQVKGGNILFVRGETQGQERDGTDTARVINPDEINIDEDDEDIHDESSGDDGLFLYVVNLEILS